MYVLATGQRQNQRVKSMTVYKVATPRCEHQHIIINVEEEEVHVSVFEGEKELVSAPSTGLIGETAKKGLDALKELFDTETVTEVAASK